jgi:hypothetical protein
LYQQKWDCPFLRMPTLNIMMFQSNSQVIKSNGILTVYDWLVTVKLG